ncbi:MAG: gamma-glutamylcyclotransferase [Gammaproteobacteria bacterium]
MELRLGLNREYQKFARENFERGARSLDSNAPEDLREAFRTLWEAYENFLDGMAFPAETIRKRNVAFETMLHERGLHDHFVGRVLGLSEAGLLADLAPRICHEETFQRTGQRRAHEHKAYASDYERIRSGGKPRQPVARLLSLLYVVRNNLQHGQKILPQEWPEMRNRNLIVFRLTAPLQRGIVQTLFETICADGVFAYDTLRSSSPGFSMIEKLVDDVVGDYFVSGKLYDLGTHRGLVIGHGEEIRGEILRSARLHELLALTDNIEGAQFRRRLSWARHNSIDGELALVWVYEFVGDLAKSRGEA